jgi:AcrR family transcriptional regulator
MRKGEQTRAAVLEQAVAVASCKGLHGLSIGALATQAGLSKSGLFAHFGSKEALQQAVLEEAVESFAREVVGLALHLPGGVGRIQACFENWLVWSNASRFPGGCPLMGATFELDSQPGPLRDFVAAQQRRWLDALARMISAAVDAGELSPDTDADLLAFEINGIGLSHSFSCRLLEDPKCTDHARQAFGRLMTQAGYAPT